MNCNQYSRYIVTKLLYSSKCTSESPSAARWNMWFYQLCDWRLLNWSVSQTEMLLENMCWSYLKSKIDCWNFMWRSQFPLNICSIAHYFCLSTMWKSLEFKWHFRINQCLTILIHTFTQYMIRYIKVESVRYCDSSGGSMK